MTDKETAKVAILFALWTVAKDWKYLGADLWIQDRPNEFTKKPIATEDLYNIFTLDCSSND